MSSLAPSRERALSFELRVLPAGDDDRRFGVELAEVGGSNGGPSMRARLDPVATARVITSLLAALRDSKLKRSQLSPARTRPLKLSEAAGVRLSLVLMATAPLSLRSRISDVEEGVTAMSTEESYYWYAKCTGQDAARSRRALRLLLADE